MTPWLMWLLEKITDPSVPTVGPRALVVGPATPAVIRPPARSAWDEKKWQRRDSGSRVVFAGQYRVFDRAHRTWRTYRGQLVQDGTSIATYIADPPVEIKRHPHGPCLQLAEPPWFRLHWNRAPSHVDEGLLYMERLLDEAINQYGR